MSFERWQHEGPPSLVRQARSLILYHIAGADFSDLLAYLRDLPLLRNLDLAFYPETDFPGFIPEQIPPQLRQLTLRNARIHALIFRGNELQGLYHLGLHNCQVRHFSIQSPTALSALRKLDLSNNELIHFNLAEGAIPLLRILHLHKNELASISPAVAQLKHLRQIKLQHNFIRELPACIGELPDLESLVLGRNEISVLPPELIQCKQLSRLLLKSNCFRKFPVILYQMPWIRTLDMRLNPFSEEAGMKIGYRAREIYQTYSPEARPPGLAEPLFRLAWGDTAWVLENCTQDLLWEMLNQPLPEIRSYAAVALTHMLTLPAQDKPEVIFLAGVFPVLEDRGVLESLDRQGVRIEKKEPDKCALIFLGMHHGRDSGWIRERKNRVLGPGHLMALVHQWEVERIAPEKRKKHSQNLSRLIDSGEEDFSKLASKLLNKLPVETEMGAALIRLLIRSWDSEMEKAAKSMLGRVPDYGLQVLLDYEYENYRAFYDNQDKHKVFRKLASLAKTTAADLIPQNAYSHFKGEDDLESLGRINQWTASALKSRIEGDCLNLIDLRVTINRRFIPLPEGVEILDLGMNYIYKDNFVLSAPEQIRGLSLYGNNLRRFPHTLKAMKNLESLDLGWNLFRAFPWWWGIEGPEIKRLGLSIHDLTDELLEGICRLSKLEELSLRCTSNQRELYKYRLLGQLEHLKTLDLTAVNFQHTRFWLAPLPQIRCIRIDNRNRFFPLKKGITGRDASLGKKDTSYLMCKNKIRKLDHQLFEYFPGLSELELGIPGRGKIYQLEVTDFLRERLSSVTVNGDVVPELPAWLFQLERLEKLTLNARIKQLRGNWQNLKQLRTLKLSIQNSDTLPESWLKAPPPGLESLEITLGQGKEAEKLKQVFEALPRLKSCRIRGLSNAVSEDLQWSLPDINFLSE